MGSLQHGSNCWWGGGGGSKGACGPLVVMSLSLTLPNVSATQSCVQVISTLRRGDIFAESFGERCPADLLLVYRVRVLNCLCACARLYRSTTTPQAI